MDHRNSGFLPLKMVIFHGYDSLPEGNRYGDLKEMDRHGMEKFCSNLHTRPNNHGGHPKSYDLKPHFPYIRPVFHLYPPAFYSTVSIALLKSEDLLRLGFDDLKHVGPTIACNDPLPSGLTDGHRWP